MATIHRYNGQTDLGEVLDPDVAYGGHCHCCGGRPGEHNPGCDFCSNEAWAWKRRYEMSSSGIEELRKENDQLRKRIEELERDNG